MANINEDLEEQCEDAVFQICCTREHYSVRCANQLEKYLTLVTKKQTAPVQKATATNFITPVITEDQEDLFKNFEPLNKKKIVEKKSTSKNDVRPILNRLRELKSILNQIERTKKSEINQLLE